MQRFWQRSIRKLEGKIFTNVTWFWQKMPLFTKWKHSFLSTGGGRKLSEIRANACFPHFNAQQQDLPLPWHCTQVTAQLCEVFTGAVTSNSAKERQTKNHSWRHPAELEELLFLLIAHCKYPLSKVHICSSSILENVFTQNNQSQPTGSLSYQNNGINLPKERC